jgi:hypothetical protein
VTAARATAPGALAANPRLVTPRDTSRTGMAWGVSNGDLRQVLDCDGGADQQWILTYYPNFG